MLADLDMEVLPQSAFNIEEVEETGLSFVENAILKARHAAEQTGLPAIADDSGLEVDALNGAPGIYSARYAGPAANDEQNLQKLLSDLDGIADEQRSARFQCLLVFMRHALDPTPLICQGTWEGRILDAPRGDNGFGYDPVFYYPPLDKTFAELSREEKSRVSHRGMALQELKEEFDKVLIWIEQNMPFQERFGCQHGEC